MAQLNKLRSDHEGLQEAHRQLLKRVMDLELNKAYVKVSSTKGPPPTMENLRPGYRRRSALIKEAQDILDKSAVPPSREVDEKGNVNA